MKITLFYFHFLLYILISCSNGQEINCPVGKKLLYPIDSLKEYNHVDKLNLNSFKIVYVFEASCPVCIEKIYKIDSYLQNTKDDINAQIIVILTGLDSEFTRFHLKETNSFKFPIMYDPENKFIKENKLGILIVKNCVLIGPNDIIRACGIPYSNSSDERKFKKIIKNFNK